MTRVMLLLAGLCCIAAAPVPVIIVQDAPGSPTPVPVFIPPQRLPDEIRQAPPRSGIGNLQAGGTTHKAPFAIGPEGAWAILPPGAKGTMTLRTDAPAGQSSKTDMTVSQADGVITISNRHFRITHDPKKMAGLPSRIEFAGGRTFSKFNLNDRVYLKELGCFWLRQDAKPQVRVTQAGPMATVTVSARYMQGAKPAPGNVRATYRFTYFSGLPVVHAAATVRQDAPFHWRELHFIEINYPDEFFKRWACGEPRKAGAFKSGKSSRSAPVWAALIEGDHALGLAGTGNVRLYDGRKDYGTYLHGNVTGWSGTQQRFEGWLWIGRAPKPADAVARFARTPRPRAYVTTAALHQLLKTTRDKVRGLAQDKDRARLAWLLGLGERFAHGEGRLADGEAVLRAVEQAASQRKPFDWALARVPERIRKNWRPLSNRQAAVLLVSDGSGIRLHSLCDLTRERELLAAQEAPLWELDIRLPDGKQMHLDASTGWLACEIKPARDKAQLVWRKHTDVRLKDVSVEAELTLDGPRTLWRMKVVNSGKAVSLRRIVFPNLALAVTDRDGVIAPAVSGRLHTTPVSKVMNAAGDYPSGWLSMQCAGSCGPDGGAYVGVHDPVASTKKLRMSTAGGYLKIAWTWPAPDSGVPGNSWEQQGHLAVQGYGGTWFDFAMLYRHWAGRHAQWWPRGKLDGRPDTPLWMKDVAVWALASGPARNVVGPVRKFAQYLDVPVALHWYSWHKVPFDDDYPHYFPAKDSFAGGVADLHKAGVRVMPYINGRLWDTDLDDFKNNAIKFCTKDEAGKPYIEVYGSGEKLCPMCPVTPLWNKTVQDIVLRLVSPEFDVDGVYIDQIAAAQPRLCFDRSHGHPVEGGCWWTTRGYWPMLTELQEKLPPGKMITTECNAEPYAKHFDGYLTWHFQDDGAIPLFAAVYGGTVQLFSRAYQGDSWKGLAMRMKTAQALVFGEQLGWIGPGVINDPVAGPFLKRLGKLRYGLRDYLGNGRMARPPAIKDDGATVTADWRWGGSKIVTTPAILSAAWQARDGRLVLVFVNADDKPHAFDLTFDAETYGFPANARLLVSAMTGTEAKGAPTPKPEARRAKWHQRIELKPRAAIALQISTAQ